MGSYSQSVADFAVLGIVTNWEHAFIVLMQRRTPPNRNEQILSGLTPEDRKRLDEAYADAKELSHERDKIRGHIFDNPFELYCEFERFRKEFERNIRKMGINKKVMIDFKDYYGDDSQTEKFIIVPGKCFYFEDRIYGESYGLYKGDTSKLANLDWSVKTRVGEDDVKEVVGTIWTFGNRAHTHTIRKTKNYPKCHNFNEVLVRNARFRYSIILNAIIRGRVNAYRSV